MLKVRQFHEGGEAKCTRHPHPFFGALTPAQWSRGMYKHLDHHLRPARNGDWPAACAYCVIGAVFQ